MRFPCTSEASYTTVFAQLTHEIPNESNSQHFCSFNTYHKVHLAEYQSDIWPKSLIYATLVTVIAMICFDAAYNLWMICPEYAKHEVHTRAMHLENKQAWPVKSNLKSRLRSSFGQTVYLSNLTISSRKSRNRLNSECIFWLPHTWNMHSTCTNIFSTYARSQ